MIQKIITMTGKQFNELFPSQTIDRTINDPLVRVFLQHTWWRAISYDIGTDTITLKKIISVFT